MVRWTPTAVYEKVGNRLIDALIARWEGAHASDQWTILEAFTDLVAERLFNLDKLPLMLEVVVECSEELAAARFRLLAAAARGLIRRGDGEGVGEALNGLIQMVPDTVESLVQLRADRQWFPDTLRETLAFLKEITRVPDAQQVFLEALKHVLPFLDGLVEWDGYPAAFVATADIVANLLANDAALAAVCSEHFLQQVNHQMRFGDEGIKDDLLSGFILRIMTHPEMTPDSRFFQTLQDSCPELPACVVDQVKAASTHRGKRALTTAAVTCLYRLVQLDPDFITQCGASETDDLEKNLEDLHKARIENAGELLEKIRELTAMI
jgi:hypothetical protein